jgi:hypothetical protein
MGRDAERRRGGGGGGGGSGSERVAVPDPGALGVVEAVRQPLRLQQLHAVLAQVQRLAAPAHHAHVTHTQRTSLFISIY